MEPLGVTNGEGLREEGAVGVPVEMHAVDAELVEHRCQIVGRITRAIEVRRISQLTPTLANRFDVVALLRLQRLAQDGPRPAGSSVIDKQQLVAVEKRLEQFDEPTATVGGGIPGPPFHRDDRPQQRTRPIASRIELEADLDLAYGRLLAIEQDLDRSTSGARYRAALS